MMKAGDQSRGCFSNKLTSSARTPKSLLAGSWDFVSRVISYKFSSYKYSNWDYNLTISIVTLFITIVTKSHDPPRI